MQAWYLCLSWPDSFIKKEEKFPREVQVQASSVGGHCKIGGWIETLTHASPWLPNPPVCPNTGASRLRSVGLIGRNINVFPPPVRIHNITADETGPPPMALNCIRKERARTIPALAGRVLFAFIDIYLHVASRKHVVSAGTSGAHHHAAPVE
jgi:hypothetical protein